MGLRKSFSDSVSPIKKPRTIGVKELVIPEPVQYDMAEDETGTFSLEQFQRTYDRLSPLTASIFEIPPRSINFTETLETPTGVFRKLFPSFPIDLQIDVLQPKVIDLNLICVIQEGTLLLADVEVSTNIFFSLEDSLVKGKKYIENEWKNAFKKVSNKRARIDKTHTKNTFQLPLQQDDDNTISPSKNTLVPSFFDLIKPLLLPPPKIFSSGDDKFLPPGKELYKYQPKGIEKLVENKSFLLADEMGTGKTVMATLATRMLFRSGDIQRTLVLCPVSVLRVWEEHLYEWSLGEIATIVVRGPISQRKMVWGLPFHVLITSYDTFSQDIKNNIVPIDKRNFDLVILDEAQYIKNQKSARFRRLKEVNFERRWAITGTPLENKIDDVKAIFEFLLPGFIHKEENAPDKIREYIHPYMLRRLKKDVLEDLPEKTQQLIWLELSQEQKKQYQAIYTYGVAKLSELEQKGQISRPHIFSLIGKLKQVCNFPKGGIKSPKATATIDMVEEIVTSGDKVVVFSQYIEEGISKLAKVLDGYGIVTLTGDMSDSQRQISIESFRNDPNIFVLLASIKTAGVGITLTEASYVIHFDHWWNPAIMNQAEDRVHRVGQKKPVTVYEFWMENTIEERIYKLLNQKKVLAGNVIDSLAVPIESEGITVDELLHKVLQISPEDRENDKLEEVSKPESPTPNWNASRIDEIRLRLFNLHPTAFEKLVGEIFSRFGYPHVYHQGQTSDGGIDVLARRYADDGVHHAIIQCKRYRKNVGVGVARDMAGVLSQRQGNNKGYLVTSSDFTSQCKQFVSKSVGSIELINGLELVRYILMYGLDDML